MTHPWHDIPTFADRDATATTQETFFVVIEIPRGGKVKYELDKKTGLLRVDRILYSSVVYPANYGFLPGTYCDDGDPLDALVLTSEPVMPLAIMRARAIGVLAMLDDGAADDKIIAVHVDDPAFSSFTDISELPSHIGAEIRRFFQDYKALENKKVEVDPMRGAVAANQIVRSAVALYAAEREKLRQL